MGKLQGSQKGFSTVEGIMVLVIVALIGFIGWYVWHTKQSTDKSLDTSLSSTVPTPKSAKKTSSDNEAVTPQSFSASVITAVGANNETKLEALLSPDYKSFRQTNLNTSPCHGVDSANVTLFCGSILNQDIATKLVKINPSVANVTFKDGKAGKAVTYQMSNNGEPGTNCFTFKLVAHGTSWQVYDYGDVFVSQGDTAPAQVAGERNF